MKNINRATLISWQELKSIGQADVKVLMVSFFLSCLLLFSTAHSTRELAGGGSTRLLLVELVGLKYLESKKKIFVGCMLKDYIRRYY